jgi:hypothetical protein
LCSKKNTAVDKKAVADNGTAATDIEMNDLRRDSATLSQDIIVNSSDKVGEPLTPDIPETEIP